MSVYALCHDTVAVHEAMNPATTVPSVINSYTNDNMALSLIIAANSSLAP